MKIVISGYYGFGNLGDELILHNLIGLLSEHKNSIVVLSQDPDQTQKNHEVRAVSRWNPVVLWREIRSASVFISGGGGLLQDLSGPWTPVYYLSLVSIALVLRKKVILLAQGFGPLRLFWNKMLAKWIVPKADLVIPRDAEGYYWCSKKGVPEDRLVPGADLVWLQPVQQLEYKQRWVICLRADWLGHRSPEWINDLVAFARVRQSTVCFVALGDRGDQKLLNAMQADPAFQDCEFWPTPDLKNIRNAFAQAELVISMRYHGLVLGAMAGAALIGMGNDPKIKIILDTLEQPWLDLQGSNYAWTVLMEQLSDLQSRVRHNTKRMQETAQSGMAHALERIGKS
jgi:polysaccharide pyruvyl transferase CsaB